jgi:nicotinamide/nicotinate riboside kinase
LDSKYSLDLRTIYNRVSTTSFSGLNWHLSTTETKNMSSKALLIGISGPSSSGKTTLARLLRSILPNSFIVHQDDFYKTDADIPYKYGVQDWDCLEAFDLSQLRVTLEHVKVHGNLPENFQSKEDQNEVGESTVKEDVIIEHRRRVRALTDPAESFSGSSIAIIDGILLYAEAIADIREMFDVKLFLRASHITAKRRREARSGYVTLDGFWKDPPGYVDEVVWPNYVLNHGFLFARGDVDGMYNEDVLQRTGIMPMPDEADGDMTRCLEWAYMAIEPALRALIEGIK